MPDLFSTETEKSRTRGNLVPARLYAADNNGKDKEELTIHCSFNPYEYTVSQTNNYDYKPKAGAETKVEFKSAGPQTLKLSLIFDAFENNDSKDVSQTTRKLWKLMTPDYVTEVKKPDAPFVIFEWGVFKFLAVITNMTQKFILFDHNGVPLRAKVDITFTQHKSETKDYQALKADVTSPQTAAVLPNGRLDSMAADNLGDPASWRDIAEANNITNPLTLRPGQNLLIPGGKNG
jgi:hypothetical protein